jgi:hypothetical protein
VDSYDIVMYGPGRPSKIVAAHLLDVTYETFNLLMGERHAGQ